MIRRSWWGVVSATLLAAAPAAAAGAWQTFLHARNFTDLLALGDGVWCATAEAGLLRFRREGAEFVAVVREPGGLASNRLTALAADRRGWLWVGTRGAGVSRLSPDGRRWSLINVFDGLPVDSVTTLEVAGDTVWIGTRRGLALWNGREISGSLPDGITTSFDATFPLPAVTGIAMAGDSLFLSTPRGVGVARLSTGLADWTPVNDGLASIDVDRLAFDGASLMAQARGVTYLFTPSPPRWTPTEWIGWTLGLGDDAGVILAGSDRGVHRWTGTRWLRLEGSPAVVLAPGATSEPTVGPGGVHYVGTRGTLHVQQPENTPWARHAPPGPPGNGIMNLALDGERLYVATRSEGVGRFDGRVWRNWLPGACGSGPACDSTFANPVNSFALLVDRSGAKWVGCWGVAMEHFDDRVSPPVFRHWWTGVAPDDRHTFALGAAADSNGHRWFGMDTPEQGVPGREALGLDVYDSTGAYAGTWGPGSPAGSLVRNGKIRAVTVDRAGRVWIGYAGSANSGVDHFVRRPASGYDFQTVPLTQSLDVWGLVAHGDAIWLLTDSDLRRISRTATPPRVVQTFTTPAGRPFGIRLLDVGPDGAVWVGSEEGVRVYWPDGSSQDLNTANSPLADNEVRAIAVDRASGAVWIGTAAGLNRYDPRFVAVPPGAGRDTLLVYPSPGQLTGIGVRLRLRGAAESYTGEIYDLGGRLVHRFRGADRDDVFWDGRDTTGAIAPPGVYFVRARGGGREAFARFVLLR